ncbi:MAG: hypothetical protein KY392_06945 [Chloroflexi bacterium]|nr:hypothetical protein [Chloroflexota bacterium]
MAISGFIPMSALPATMPGSATQMYAKNLQTLLKHLMDDGKIELDFSDEITRGATITHDGKVIHEATAQALGIEVEQPATPTSAEASTEPDAPSTAPAADKEPK